jgi:hypothetical protein
MMVTVRSVPTGGHAVAAVTAMTADAVEMPGAIMGRVEREMDLVPRGAAKAMVVRGEAPNAREGVTAMTAGVEETGGIGVPDPSP